MAAWTSMSGAYLNVLIVLLFYRAKKKESCVSYGWGGLSACARGHPGPNSSSASCMVVFGLLPISKSIPWMLARHRMCARSTFGPICSFYRDDRFFSHKLEGEVDRLAVGSGDGVEQLVI
jgi:hypothetical protein